MAIPAFLRFDPVSVRARRDGWTAARQRCFILNLARGMGVTEAAAHVGRSRQTAYALRERPGAGTFAAAWDTAVDFAARARRMSRPLGASRGGIETVLVPRFYRGRLIGFVQREDLSGAMRTLAALDRAAERIGEVDLDDPAVTALFEMLNARDEAEADEADKIILAKGASSSAFLVPRAFDSAGRTG